MTAYDEAGVIVDLSEFGVGISFENIGVGFDVGDGYDSLITEDGRVQFTMNQAMLDADRWHVGGWGPFDWLQHIAAPQGLVDGCGDCGDESNNWPPEHRLVADAIAAGGTCDFGISCVSPPAADIDGDCRVGMYELIALADAWLNPKDLSDLAELADNWLDCGLDPPSACW